MSIDLINKTLCESLANFLYVGPLFKSQTKKSIDHVNPDK